MNTKDKITEKRKVRRDGELDLVGFKIPCFVLEDGTRVLSSRGMQDALKIVGEDSKLKRGPRLKYFLAQKSLKPFIDKEKKGGSFKPIICYKGKTEIHAYEATVLPDICIILSELEKEAIKQGKKLPSSQAIVVKQCEMLLRSFARTGIIGLVDEATGYQKEKEETLQEVLRPYISEEILKWQKNFHSEFYEQIFRLWNLPSTPESMKKKPSFVGILTDKLVYKNLPKGSFVIDRNSFTSEESKEKTTKTKESHLQYRLNESLTEKGREELKKAIYTLVAYARISKDKNKFLRLMKESHHLQEELPYIDIEAMDDDKKETKFDKAVKTLLNTPTQKKSKKKK